MFLNNEAVKELGGKLNGKGCIVFDLACYFPYSNQEILNFGFRLDNEEPEPYKLNHRYPNRGYVTISKKDGRRLSKLGYPLFVELDREQSVMLSVIIGTNDDEGELLFPIHVTLTKEEPVCALGMHLDYDKKNLDFSSCYKKDDCGWHRVIWVNPGHPPCNREDMRYLGAPDVYTDDGITIYHDVIRPYPQRLEDLAMF